MNLEQAVAIFESHLATSHLQDCCETRRAVLRHDVRNVALAVRVRMIYIAEAEIGVPMDEGRRFRWYNEVAKLESEIDRLFPEGEKS